MDTILEQFLSEARDNLAFLDTNLKKLESGDENDINALFRAAHTLKGGAGLVGFTCVKEITHVAEDLLDALRQKKIDYAPSMLDVLYDVFDEVVELIDAAEEIGGTTVSFDDEILHHIKEMIGQFFPSKISEVAANLVSYSPAFKVNNQLSLSGFNHQQICDIAAKISLHPPKITEAFYKNNNYWIVDLDLDVETLRSGNDPFYIFYLLESDAVIAIKTEVFQCDKMDAFDWRTRITAVIFADEPTIEDIFYNFLDEATFAPLSIDSFFQTHRISMENEIFNGFIHDVQNKGIRELSSKRDTLLDNLDPSSKEFFILNRYKILLEFHKEDSLELFVLNALGIILPNQKPEEVDNNAKDNAIKILIAQKEALKTVGSLERTKLILENTLAYLNLEESLEKYVSEVALSHFIDTIIDKLNLTVPQTLPTPHENIMHNEPIKDVKVDEIKESISKKELNNLSKTIKIDQEEIDYLMDIVGEILVIKNSIPYITHQISEETLIQSKRDLISKYEEISRVTDQLQDRVMGMRLLPISYIFSRYPKLVRDISKSLGKNIEYIEYGSETKLDKMMIEKIADPLVHLIRNSLDHGIENEADRIASNKPTKGTLKVGARSEGDRVFIEIYDDGKGINTDIVVMKALEKGLINPDTLDGMSEEEKMKLIFLPGLSTKSIISDLSGRGVGTDAVRSTVDALGGKIYLESELGKYTKTTLEIPVSVALTNVFHLLLGGVNYGLAMEHIIETEKITQERIKTAHQKPFIRLRGEIIPLILSPKLLHRSSLKEEENLLIVRTKVGKVALVVDSFIGQLNVVQKPLTGALKNHALINGVSLLGDGAPLLILNVNALMGG